VVVEPPQLESGEAWTREPASRAQPASPQIPSSDFRLVEGRERVQHHGFHRVQRLGYPID
jgi:hypothetical protein